ncbi:hypothetical protein H9P43_009399 [Blastocladiella emersonii ATCC 22665]|nr:hypothetical protein H9P43_009399 [Blastocladiella emersonii ATCC 22665]
MATIKKDTVTGKPTAAAEPSVVCKDSYFQTFLDVVAIIARLIMLAWVTEQLLDGPSQLKSITWMAESLTASGRADGSVLIALHHSRWAARAWIAAASAVQLVVYAWAMYAARTGKEAVARKATVAVLLSATVLSEIQRTPERYGLPLLDMFDLSLFPLILAAGVRALTGAGRPVRGPVVM